MLGYVSWEYFFSLRGRGDAGCAWGVRMSNVGLNVMLKRVLSCDDKKGGGSGGRESMREERYIHPVPPTLTKDST